MSKKAILFLNLGGPKTLNDVHPFLLRLFSDADLIKLPLQPLLSRYIAKTRTPRIQKQYAEIGGGSPISDWTEKQGNGMISRLKQKGLDYNFYYAFRYANPLTEESVQRMLNDGITECIAFSQYPQYSCTTTGSSLNELMRWAKKLDKKKQIKWSVIDQWQTHPGLVNTFSKHIKDALEFYPKEERVHILFSAHSLPMSVVARGDRYPQQVAATVESVMQRLEFKHPYTLVWQSQVGPKPWLSPKTDASINGLLANGIHNVLLVPIAFTSDHVETLYELDREYIHEAKEKGMKGIRRVESLNDDPLFLDCLADLVYEHNGETSQQLKSRCPQCVNEKCAEMKAFFSQE